MDKTIATIAADTNNQRILMCTACQLMQSEGGKPISCQESHEGSRVLKIDISTISVDLTIDLMKSSIVIIEEITE